MIFLVLFVSRYSELDRNLSGDFQKKFSSELHENLYVDRGRSVMHDGMLYGRKQGQGQGHSRDVDRQSPTALIRLDALAFSVIATATWLGGWLAGWVAVCLSRYCIETTQRI